MIIDFHTHAYPDALAVRTVNYLSKAGGIPHFTDGTLADLEEKERAGGVSRFVLLNIATVPKNEHNVNLFAMQSNSREHPAFGSVHPDSERWREELFALQRAGMIGVKFHNEYQNFNVDEERALPVYAECARLGLVMVFHGGADIGFPNTERCSALAFSRVAQMFPSANFIFAHLGGMKSTRESVRYLAPLSNVYTDTAFSSQNLSVSNAREIVQAFGAERILFGTDMPWDTPEHTIEYVRSLRLSPAEQQKIFCENAKTLLGA